MALFSSGDLEVEGIRPWLYATWAHGAIHSTGHPSRPARDLTGALGRAANAREELAAELGAVLLGERLEIGSDVRHHAASSPTRSRCCGRRRVSCQLLAETVAGG